MASSSSPDSVDTDPYDSTIIETADEVEVPDEPPLALAALLEPEPEPEAEPAPLSVSAPSSLEPLALPSFGPLTLSLQPTPTPAAPFAALVSDIPPPIDSTREPVAAAASISDALAPPGGVSMPVIPSASVLLTPPLARPAAVLPRPVLSRRSPRWLIASAAVSFVGACAFFILRSPTPDPSRASAPVATAVHAAAVAAPVVEVKSSGIAALLQANEERAQRKRAEAKAFAQTLRAEPSRAADAVVQAKLVQLSADPETFAVALEAMALAPSPFGPDLLFQVWTGRASDPDASALARALLSTREVRANASPALAVALELREAETCEASRVALLRAERRADGRSLPPLVKLAQRRGCGASKREDCYPCIRENAQQLDSALKGAVRRHPPSYPVSR